MLLARLYNKRAGEYRELATPIAREALLLNPNEKEAHKANLEAAECPMPDWNVAKSLAAHCIFTRNLYANIRIPGPIICGLWICSWRTDARQKLGMPWRPWAAWSAPITMTSMTVWIAKEEGNLPRALDCWKSMTDKEPESWMAWFLWADSLAKAGPL